MKIWKELTPKEKWHLLIMVLLTILFGFRYYPDNWSKTFTDSLRYLFAYFFYGGVTSYLTAALLKKIFKVELTPKQILKFALFLSLFSAITQGFYEYSNRILK